MVDQHRIENVVQEYMSNGVINLIVRIVGISIEWILVLILGFEWNKLISHHPRDIWTLVEFFTVLSLCVLIWLLKCCCLKRICRKFIENSQGADVDENVPKEEVGLIKAIVQKLHLILNRVAVAVVGYEIRKRLFAKTPMDNWDYAEVIAVILFCVWIFTIKYCILKCKCIELCRSCSKCHGNPKDKDVEASNTPSEPKVSETSAGNADK